MRLSATRATYRRAAAGLSAVSLLLGAACAAPNVSRSALSEAVSHARPAVAGDLVVQPAAPQMVAPEAIMPPAAPAEAEPMAAVEEHTSGRAAWRPLEVERRPFPRRVEQWRGLVREVMAEEWEHGTLDGPASRLDEDLVLAVIEQESQGNPRARSWAGAMGLMQVMDFTFALMLAGDERHVSAIDKDAFWDERSNVRAGIRYLSLAMRYHDGDVYWSLASYNAGIGNARRWRQAGLYAVPPVGGYVETADYAPIIMRSYLRHRPDVSLYVPDRMPEEHVPGALQLLRESRRRPL